MKQYLHKYDSSDYTNPEIYQEPYTALNPSDSYYSNSIDLINKDKELYYNKAYLGFHFLESGTLSFYATDTDIIRTVYYRRENDEEWSELTSSIEGTSITVFKEEIIFFRAINSSYALSTTSYNYFYSTAKFNLEGNLFSLINYNENPTSYTSKFPSGMCSSGEGERNKYAFLKFFKNNDNLISIKKLIFPGGGARYGYYEMFSDCTSLKEVGNLNLTGILASCCYKMFANCTSLKTISKLSCSCGSVSTGGSTYWTEGGSFNSMFLNCTSLTRCINKDNSFIYAYTNSAVSMFANCTSLKSTPFKKISADFGDSGCEYMFDGCTSLIESCPIEVNRQSSKSCRYMFRNCTSLVKVGNISATGKMTDSNNFYHMFDGCTSLVKAPVLDFSTDTIFNNFYGMFINCSKLNEVHANMNVNQSDIFSVYVTSYNEFYNYRSSGLSYGPGFENWLKNVSKKGKFYKPINSIYYRGNGGIPMGWEIIPSFEINRNIFSTEGLNSGTFNIKGYCSGEISIENNLSWVTITNNTIDTDIDLLIEVSESSIEREGTFTITYINENISKEIKVIQKEYEYVDLGLPSNKLWAKYGVGASSYTDSDNLIRRQWGSLKENNASNASDGQDYIWSDYVIYDNSGTRSIFYCKLNKYYLGDGKEILEEDDDIASVYMGNNWCTPSKEDWEELMNNTTRSNVTLEGKTYVKFTSNINNAELYFLYNETYWSRNTYDSPVLYNRPIDKYYAYGFSSYAESGSPKYYISSPSRCAKCYTHAIKKLNFT